MAQRQTHTPQVLRRETVEVFGSFAPNGSSAVSAASNKGEGWSVAYISTGLFRITFADTWASLDSALHSLQLATGDDKYLQFGAYVAASKTLDIRVWDASAGAVADIAADANNRIHFLCYFDNRTPSPP